MKLGEQTASFIVCMFQERSGPARNRLSLSNKTELRHSADKRELHTKVLRTFGESTANKIIFTSSINLKTFNEVRPLIVCNVKKFHVEYLS